MKQAIFSTLLIGLSIVLALALAEGVLRLKNANGQNYDIEMWHYAKKLKVRSADPALGHEHVPNAQAILQNTLIRTDSRGLRGPEPRNPPPARRILLLGSSITLGWGVDEEKTLAALLQQGLGGTAADAEVLNAGIGNYNASRYVTRFMTRLSDLNPTDIVVHYFLRDAEVLDAGGGPWLLEHSQLAVTLWIAYHKFLGRTGEATLVEHYRKLYQPDSEGFVAMAAALDQLQRYANAHGIRVYLAMQPDVHNLVNYPFGYIHQLMLAEATRRGFTFVDLLPGFIGHRPETIWAIPGDPHPNATGHKIMADALLPVIAAPR